MVSVWLLLREFGVPITPWLVVPGFSLLVLAGLFTPLREQLHQGQWNLVLLLLFTEAWICQRRDRPVLAGCLVGLAAVLKLFPGFLLLFFLLRRQWRAAAAAVVSALALTL